MARIQALAKTTFDRRAVHDPVASCLYDVYEIGGQRYLQINTYGRADRKHPEKPSQVIQLDLKSSEMLRAVLDEAFGSPAS